MHLKESEKLELKKSTAELKEGVISIAAILNKHGAGLLYFGVKNDGTAVGLDISEKTLRDVAQEIANHLEPKIYPVIEAEEIVGKPCIKVAFSGNDMPYLAYGRAYMRVADADRQLTVKALENIFVRKNSDRLRWEIHSAQISVKDLSTGIMKSFIKKANDAGRIGFKFDNVVPVSFTWVNSVY